MSLYLRSLSLQDTSRQDFSENTYHTAEDRFYAVRQPEQDLYSEDRQQRPEQNKFYAGRQLMEQDLYSGDRQQRPEQNKLYAGKQLMQQDLLYAGRQLPEQNKLYAGNQLMEQDLFYAGRQLPEQDKFYAGRRQHDSDVYSGLTSSVKTDRIGPAYWNTDKYADDVYDDRAPPYGKFKNYMDYDKKWDYNNNRQSAYNSFYKNDKVQAYTGQDRWDDQPSKAADQYESTERYDRPLSYDDVHDHAYESFRDQVDRLDVSSNAISDRNDRPRPGVPPGDLPFSMPGFTSILAASLGVRDGEEGGTTTDKEVHQKKRGEVYFKRSFCYRRVIFFTG